MLARAEAQDALFCSRHVLHAANEEARLNAFAGRVQDPVGEDFDQIRRAPPATDRQQSHWLRASRIER
jgi:hypothetical protein